jgi:uncharacterized protein YecT (DUF1311 family)
MFKRAIASFFLSLLALAATASHAAGCNNAADCQAQAQAADTTLNSAYKSLMSALPTAGQGRLRESQRAWIMFRDKECAFRASRYPDAASPARDACLAGLTQQRAEALAAMGEAFHPSAAMQADKSRIMPPAGAPISCLQSVGKTQANEYVRQCIQVSPATHPPCNVSNACSLITDEISRGCGMLGSGDAPGFCKAYPR